MPPTYRCHAARATRRAADYLRSTRVPLSHTRGAYYCTAGRAPTHRKPNYLLRAISTSTASPFSGATRTFSRSYNALPLDAWRGAAAARRAASTTHAGDPHHLNLNLHTHLV